MEAGARLDVVDGDGRNCAHLAAHAGCAPIIQYLAFHGKHTLLNAEDIKDKKTPLHLAAQANQADAVTALIESGVNVNAIDSKRIAFFFSNPFLILF